MSKRALEVLELFPWPGNIRQLENVMQHATLVSSGPELLVSHLPQPLQEHAESVGNTEEGGADSLQHQRDVIERNVILRALINSSRTGDET